jgi:WD40 repeat protein
MKIPRLPLPFSACVFGAIAATPLVAAPELALNLVWSRVADVNGEAGSIESAEFSPDGRRIVSGSKFDNSVIMWRTSDGHELWRAAVAAEIERVGWSPDGKVVAACSEDFMVTIFDAANGNAVKTIPHPSGIDALTWSHDGRWLATGEEHIRQPNGTMIGKARLFRMPEATLDREADFGETINFLVFTADDKFLVAAGHNGLVRVYATADMKLAREFKADPTLHLTCVALTPDQRYLAASGYGGAISVWEFATGKLVKRFNQTGRKIETLAWSRDGQYLFTAGHDPSIHVTRLRDILDKDQTEVYAAHKSAPTDYMEYLHVSPNGAFVTSAHQDGMIRLWVFMNEDPAFNTKRHRWVSAEQAKQQESLKKKPVLPDGR